MNIIECFVMFAIITRRISSRLQSTSTSTSTSTSNFCKYSSALFNAKLVEYDSLGMKECADALRKGGLVAFPTETVYGLGANALNAKSVEAIFAAKSRPASDPVIVHVLSKEAIFDLFDFNDISGNANTKCISICEELCDAFWPGPLTIIYKAAPTVPSCVTAGSGFVGIRSPRHPIARELLEQSQVYVAAPSANRFGHVSPTTAQHVLNDLHGQNILIIEDDIAISGGCNIGIESTVCQIQSSGDEIRILRCGAVTSSQMQSVLDRHAIVCKVIVDNEKNLVKMKSTPGSLESSHELSSIASDHNQEILTDGQNLEGAVSPGQMVRHYAPDIPTFICRTLIDINPVDESDRNVDGFCASVPFPVHLGDTLVLDFGGRLAALQHRCRVYRDLSKDSVAEEACISLFSALREAEGDDVRKNGVQAVLVPDLRLAAEGDELVRALWERLRRAASGLYVDLLKE